MDSLRISDAERDEAVRSLGDHYVAGRLDKVEYDERCDAVWSARTRGDLRPVFADLEAPQPVRIPPRDPRAVRPGGPRRSPSPWLVVLVVLGVLTALTHLPIIIIGLVVWSFLRMRSSSPARRRHSGHYTSGSWRGPGGRWS